MHIYLKNNPAKLHPDPIWNDGALGVFWRGGPKQEQDEYEYMRSVPDLKLN